MLKLKWGVSPPLRLLTTPSSSPGQLALLWGLSCILLTGHSHLLYASSVRQDISSPGSVGLLSCFERSEPCAFINLSHNINCGQHFWPFGLTSTHSYTHTHHTHTRSRYVYIVSDLCNSAACAINTEMPKVSHR